MIRVLLDTHALLWALASPERLSLKVRQILADPANRRLVSSVSAFEVATKYRLGKLPEAADIVRGYADHLVRFQAQELVVSTSHALMAGGLQTAHRDPFDRLLAAQSILEGLPLVTCDPVFASLSVQTVW